MPNPTVSDLHVQAALTDISVAYAQGATRFVAGRMFPVIPVMKKSDKYFVMDQGDWQRSEAQPRAAGAAAARSGWRLSKDTYYAERIALGHPVSDPERDNADPAVANLDADATEYVTEQVLIKNDQDWGSAFFTTGVWDGASSSTDMTGQANPASTASNFRHWNDVASTPIEDIDGEKISVESKTGRMVNVAACGPRVWVALKNHPDILDRIKYTERGIVTEDLLASLFDLDEFMVARAVVNSGAEGAANSVDFIHGRNLLLAHRADSPGLRTPTAGYTFSWTGRPGAPSGGVGARIKQYRDETHESDIIEGETWRDFKVVGSSLGAFFTTAVST